MLGHWRHTPADRAWILFDHHVAILLILRRVGNQPTPTPAVGKQAGEARATSVLASGPTVRASPFASEVVFKQPSLE